MGIILDDKFEHIFTRSKKCIVNTDIDGIIAGMLLQQFLDWEVVGYSSCCGKDDDELWLKDAKEDIKKCVFVDLPVSGSAFSAIDQHFVSFDADGIKKYNEDGNKVNPNVMRKRVFKNKNRKCEYTSKYPFGTAHFVLAVLENLKMINKDYVMDLNQKIEDFDLADLLLRADRVIGNTFRYNNNCFDWAEWMMTLGGQKTQTLFDIVKNEYKNRLSSEKIVEELLLSYGCKGTDGDCSNLFRIKDYEKISKYFGFLGDSFSIKSLPVYDIYDFKRLKGQKLSINNYDLSNAKQEINRNNVFSFAFVNMHTLSLTLFKE